jgi:ribosomal protein L40E
MRFLRWQFLHRLIERIRAWRIERRSPRPVLIPLEMNVGPYHSAAIHRDVTPNGVRVYSVCASCGARLQASATLCEECAQKKSRPARPY